MAKPTDKGATTGPKTNMNVVKKVASGKVDSGSRKK